MKNSQLGFALLVLAAGCFNEKCSFGPVDGCGPGVTGIYGQYDFIGAGTVDDPEADHLHPTARGGYQSITLKRHDENAAIIYSMESTNPQVIEVQQNGGGARVHAVGVGSAELQLFAKDKKEVIDAVPISSVTVKPELQYGRVTTLPSVVARKVPVLARVRLGDAVDDRSQLTTTGGLAALDGAWYKWRVVVAKTATALTLTAESGTATSPTLELPIVETVEELWLTNEDKLLAGVLKTQEHLEICPYATSGGKEVISAVPTMQATGPVYFLSYSWDPPAPDACKTLAVTTKSGSAQITLRFGTLSRTYDFEVGQSDMQASTPDDLAGLDAGSDL